MAYENANPDGTSAQNRILYGSTPDNVTKLDGLAPAGWLDTVAKIHASAAPGVTRTIPVDVRTMRNTTLLVTPSTLGAMPPGGGMQIVNPSGFTNLITDTVFTAPQTLPWAVTILAKIPVPVSGEYFWFGITIDGTNFYCICEQYNGGERATQLSIFQYSTAGGANYQQGNHYTIDAAYHNFTLAGDTVSVKLLVDGIEYINTPFTGPTGACRLSGRCTSHYVPITDVAIAF